MNLWNGHDLNELGRKLVSEANEHWLDDIPRSIGGSVDMIGPVTAAIMRASKSGHPMIHGSIVRSENKEYGTGGSIANLLKEGTKIMVIDDKVEASTLDVCVRFLEAKYKIVGMILIGGYDRPTELKDISMFSERFNIPVRGIL